MGDIEAVRQEQVGLMTSGADALESGLSGASRTACHGDPGCQACPSARCAAVSAPALARASRALGGGIGEHTGDEGSVRTLIERGEHRAALVLLMGAYGDVVYAFCLRIVKDAALAEDVRQKVFIQAYQGMSKFAGLSSPRTWLLGIAKFRSLDALRSLRREAAWCWAEDDALNVAADGDDDPGAFLESERAKRALEACLEACVSADEKSLILMRYRDELSYEEMSERLGEKADTLRARVARALVKLRRGLEPRDLRFAWRRDTPAGPAGASRAGVHVGGR
jgi:RNA polymerase sigma-70 factor, ECF subfamily